MCLCTLVRSVGLSDSKYVLLEEKVAMFLNVIAHDYKNRNIKFNFMRSGQTVSQYFNDVLKAILRLQGVLLKTPEPITANCTDDRWRCFQNCLGALDGTYVRVRVPAIDKPRYRTRKGEIATNVLGVCSQDMQFIYVLPGWEGSASDSRVLRDAVNRPNGLKVPTGFYYLVDAGYTNGEGFLAPYRGQRYHLSTWREGGIPVNPEEFFNMKHSAARNVIERCFGLLKIRWAILRTASYYPIKTQGRIITACCLLHNLIRREMPMDPFEFELNNTPIPQPDLGEEFINTVEPSNQWSDWRDTLANIMFNEWQANRGVGGNPP
ncbi:protein ALP1-like [Camellia sinensis]|uniref:protein ALP1-like n=1 Tax=Camellia sinensis TaxID=4442 RepID=UPI001036441E|nr:protein ALP1-like [Camellia sinensis]